LEAEVAEIGLGEVIRALRAELEEAMSEGEGSTIRFEATSVDLEFNVGITRTADGKAGIRFWVLELGGGGSYASERVQSVKLSLQPVSADGGRVKITQGVDESPLASAQPGGE
jgi:hypothetical protein